MQSTPSARQAVARPGRFAAAAQHAVYRRARHAYQALCNRPHATWRRDARVLFAEFVQRGDLVFDVGANTGDFADVFLDLGARVVAVEPNPLLAARIRARYPVTVEEAAVGAAAGTCRLHLGRDPGHSTLSDRWLAAAPTHDRWSGASIEVPVTTLELLAARHGAPAFVKIDVEGYEAAVLRGSSKHSRALAFEYQCADLDVAAECLALLDGYELNSAASGQWRLGRAWGAPADVWERLLAHRRADRAGYGDVYARRPCGVSHWPIGQPRR